jgi:hypothetical protein
MHLKIEIIGFTIQAPYRGKGMSYNKGHVLLEYTLHRALDLHGISNKKIYYRSIERGKT